MISPTGHSIRGIDVWGQGKYGAPRDNGTRIHKGADFICIPGQDIVSPINGVVVREKIPYSTKSQGILFGGLLIKNSHCEITMFYFEPLKEVIKMPIIKGQVIGKAQDIGLRYPGIVPHVHLQIDSINPELFINLP